jgi:soluble lytic murein transglycosylase-like protein
MNPIVRVSMLLAIFGASINTHAFCFDKAAERYGVDAKLLIAIAQTESGLNPRAVNRNRDGSADYGLMQINSENLKAIELTPIEVMEPCLNVHVGAWILSKFIHTHGATWRAVGAYNAGSKPDREGLRATYAAKVAQRLSRATNQVTSTRGAASAQVAPEKEEP